MYKHIVVAGTFDGLHKGHIHFLTKAFEAAGLVTIGLTSEAYIRRFKRDKGVSAHSKRYAALTKWLRRQDFAPRTQIVPLDNKWGPAIMADSFDAIAVTSDNRDVAEEINSLRAERGLPKLAIVGIDLIEAEDKKPISSTRLREGEIDKQGHLRLPDNLRLELQKPLGKILVADDIKTAVQNHRDDVVITVGDVTTEVVFACGVKPALAIIDLQVERKPYQSFEAFKFPKEYQIYKLVSGPGYIAKNAVETIKNWVKSIRTRKRAVLVIDGEEDLLTLPAIAEAPVGSLVYYGQPPAAAWACGPLMEGLVEVVITAEKKKEVEQLLSRFLVSSPTS